MEINSIKYAYLREVHESWDNILEYFCQMILFIKHWVYYYDIILYYYIISNATNERLFKIIRLKSWNCLGFDFCVITEFHKS